MSTKLYVGNIPFKITEDELRDLFAQYGQVSSVDIIMDRMTQRPRGFAFVTMETAGDAQKAIESLHGQEFGGRNLTVNEARPQVPRSGGGGGGGAYWNRGPSGRSEPRW